MTTASRQILLYITLALGCVAATPGAAQIPDSNKERDKYIRCIALSKSDPDAAFDMALAWKDFGGGDAASHCIAAALMGLKIYGEAARRFETLAQESKTEKHLRADILAHAAQAWLLDGNVERAESVLDAAIGMKPDDAGLLIDRAAVRAEAERYKDADTDLSRAVALDPKRAEAYVFRASARRRLGRHEAARRDIDRALAIEPGNVAGLLERGILHRLNGDNAAARAAWLKVIELAPGSRAAKSARANLEQMDVKKNAKP